MKILVLLGGASSEREVSLHTGEAVIAALRSRGHDVTPFDPAPEGRRDPSRLLNAVKSVAFDVVFVALHGGDGEDGHVQALLDLAGVPYTGSGMGGSYLAMDKTLSKALFEQTGILTPPWRPLADGNLHAARGAIAELGGLPVVVKPVCGGSTVGISIVESDAKLGEAIETALAWDAHLLIERYIPGRELTVAVLGDRALPVVEIVPESGFYDYTHKYTPGKSRYIVPAELPDALAAHARAVGLAAFRLLRCRGVARVDFRLSPENDLFCLEANTVPGLTATSLVPMAAREVGLDFPALTEELCRLAIDA